MRISDVLTAPTFEFDKTRFRLYNPITHCHDRFHTTPRGNLQVGSFDTVLKILGSMSPLEPRPFGRGVPHLSPSKPKRMPKTYVLDTTVLLHDLAGKGIGA